MSGIPHRFLMKNYSLRQVDTSKNTLETLQTWYMDYSAALGKLGSDASDFVALKSMLKALIVDVKDVLVEGGPFALKGLVYKEKWDELQNLLLESVQVMKEEGGGFASLYNSYWADIEKICSGLLENIHLLRYWCAWQSAKKDAIGASLKPLVDFVESGGDTNCDIKTLFMVNYCRWWVNAVIDEDEVLKNFVPAEHIAKIKEFAELDVSLMKLTSQYVYAKIASSIPSRSSVPKNSGWSILSRELQKKKRHMPLRQLISKMPDVITNLAPCVMMSPMSIAQYLQADSELFDVVIFDEASQIAIWDAIGAIARGKHCIIVGDPKQLPPTSFFDRQDSEDADSDVEIEDLESILDEALGANVPNLLLNWHYRSRCESLITFSNHRYYGGHLVTFPSTKAGHMSVSFQHVQGIYEKGGSRTNPIEAKAIVDEISSRISGPGFNKTIGVVTCRKKLLLRIYLKMFAGKKLNLNITFPMKESSRSV